MRNKEKMRILPQSQTKRRYSTIEETSYSYTLEKNCWTECGMVKTKSNIRFGSEKKDFQSKSSGESKSLLEALFVARYAEVLDQNTELL